jgi:hypothetical protein
MLHFGGTVTLNSVVVYIANNFESSIGSLLGSRCTGTMKGLPTNIPTANRIPQPVKWRFRRCPGWDDPGRLKITF